MKDWEYLIWFTTDPIFIGLLIFSMLLEPLLKYLRRFYPEGLKKSATESEIYIEKLRNNEEDNYLVKKVAKIDFLFTILPALLALTSYIVYLTIKSIPFTPLQLRDGVVFVMAPILFISIGLTNIKKEVLLKFFLKEGYQRYMKLHKKGLSIDKLAGSFEKHSISVGYFFLILGCTILGYEYFK